MLIWSFLVDQEYGGMMKTLKILVMIFLFNFASYGQDSLNCRLLTTTGNLVNAYALQVNDNVAFTGFDNFSILNISDIYSPELIFSDSISNFINSIFVDGQYVYLGTYYGFLIVDISSPENPIILSHLVTAEVIEAVIVHNGIAFLGTLNNALLVIDVSDPQNPYEISRIDENIDDVWGLEISDSLLFAASEDTGVKIFDYSDSANLIELATLTPVPPGSIVDVKVKDNIVYAAHPRNLYTFDISDINNPQLLDYLEGGGGISIEIEGDYAYCQTFHQLTVVDISNPTELKIAGYYPLPTLGSDVYVKNKIVFATCQLDGIYIIQFDEPSTIQTENQKPNVFFLSQNYPNPFNPSTTISYSINQPGFVTLKVYDILGNEVATLVSEEKQSGSYEVEFSAIGGSASGGDAYNLSSGIYFYRLTSGNYSASKKLILQK